LHLLQMTAPEAPTMSNTFESKCNPLTYTNAAEVAYHHTTDDALSHGFIIKASEEPKLIPTSLHELSFFFCGRVFLSGRLCQSVLSLALFSFLLHRS
jgi:hypothetical protein